MKKITANMSGVVVKYLVKVGDIVAIDQDILVLESMKMEMMVASTAAGKITELLCNPEDFVQEGQAVATVDG